MQQSACLVINANLLNNFSFNLNCTLVGRPSDLFNYGSDIKLFILIGLAGVFFFWLLLKVINCLSSYIPGICRWKNTPFPLISHHCYIIVRFVIYMYTVLFHLPDAARTTNIKFRAITEVESAAMYLFNRCKIQTVHSGNFFCASLYIA